jgi:5-methylthioadenosine/S-adenosylhomocysteine deaminase
MIDACCSGTDMLARMITAGHRPHVGDPSWLSWLAMADAAGPKGGSKFHVGNAGRDAKLPPRSHFIIKSAVVMTMDPASGDLPCADVHVRDGVIVAIGPDIKVEGAEIIDGNRSIVLPGFVDTHWHLWNSLFRGLVFLYGADLGYFPMKLRLGRHYTPTDMYRAVQFALAEALNSGITTVHNWAHNIVSPEHADANILAHLDTGLRGRFSYGYAEGQPVDKTMDLVDAARVQKDWFSGHANDLLSFGVALRGPESQPDEHRPIYRKEIETARKLGIDITIHVAQHRAAAVKSKSITKLAEDGFLGPDLQLVHAIHATPEEREAMGRSKTRLSLSPLTELQAGMGFPQTSEMLDAGVLVSLSIDTIAVTNADMFATMRSLFDAENARLQRRVFDPRRAIEMATIDGARDLGIADQVGTLTPGKRADLIMIALDHINMSTQPKANWPTLVVRHAQPSNISTAVVDGRILKRNGRLVAMDWERIRGEAETSGQELLHRAGLEPTIATGAKTAGAKLN